MIDTQTYQTIDLPIIHTSSGHLCIFIFCVVYDGIIFDWSQATRVYVPKIREYLVDVLSSNVWADILYFDTS